MSGAVLVCIREMSAALARIREQRIAPARNAAHHLLSHACIFSLWPQAAAATAFPTRLEEVYASFSVAAGARLLRTSE